MAVAIDPGFAFGAAGAGAAGECVLTPPDERPTIMLAGVLVVVGREHGRTEAL
jgi:hypothetical protein